jgi:ribonuclease Z
MASSFRSFLVNDLFGDPALYVSLAWERRALLFDLGDLARLSAGRLLKISDVFVSHAHIDHFVGFDDLLRVLLGRPKTLRLYGPAGFLDRVAGKLAGYTWNLVDEYALVLEAAEVLPDRMRWVRFACANRFAPECGPTREVREGIILEEPLFRVRAAPLDHQIPCLGFALEETMRININKARLDALGLPVGPWLMDVKRAVRARAPDDLPIRVAWSAAGDREERILSLGALCAEIVRAGRGQKLAYVTDAGYTPANRAAIVALARGADLFYCEAGYPERDRRRAEVRHHLTARQAGRLAAEAGARHLSVFHFSPKYRECPGELVAEAMAAFSHRDGRGAAPDPPV